MITPKAEEKYLALRRMKVIATGAFLFMALVYTLTRPFGDTPILWLVRWDHINAFAEAAMVGALADWFAVVALFRHPLGIPIWHTAIIPRKRVEIGRNLGNFVETRLLSVENLSAEIGRFSISDTLVSWLADEATQRQAANWLADGLENILEASDDEEVQRLLADAVRARLQQTNAAHLLAGGLDLLIASSKHEELADEVLHRVAEWIPTHRDTIEEFIERSVQGTLKWGSRLVPQRSIDRATDQTLTALIEVLTEAATDSDHPLRRDLNERMREWTSRLRDDPEWIVRVNGWKDELMESPTVRSGIDELWQELKRWLSADVASADSKVREYALRGIRSFRKKLEHDEKLRTTLDARLRDAAVSLLSRNHTVVGRLIQKVVDSWDGERLAREIELNLGRDLQYIRLNGTIIGGLVGLLIHIIAG